MRRVHRVSALLLVAGGLLVLPAGAGAATVTVSPTSLTFAPQAVGTTSASQQVTLTKDCTGANQTQCLGGFGMEGPTFNTLISVDPPFKQTNNCPAALTASPLPDPGTKASCTINVTLAPTAVGTTMGALTTGQGGPGATLNGAGIPAPSGASAKKCKRKKGAAAAKKKKCKKKKKKSA